MSDEVLDDEERALLEAHSAGDAEPEAPAAEPEVSAEEPAEEPEPDPAPDADETPVEAAGDGMECPPERRVIPAQWDGDPWGDTPMQSRY